MKKPNEKPYKQKSAPGKLPDTMKEEKIPTLPPNNKTLKVPPPPPSPKGEQLEQYKKDDAGQALTTNQGLKIAEDQFSTKAGERGPTLMEDFHFREKVMHFDHERIPERIVHARGSGAHGVFECTADMSAYTKAKFLQKGKKTPVFVRFSTVAGSRGSTDTPRDVRGFATKFYTEEGNYDLVGNNIPVFFIQDAIKFPDFIHAVKPEPHNEMPQAASAHDTFWDFVTQNQETAHMTMWAMSDRSIPRSLRMMDGFGVHTFRFVNEAGKGTFVKFHWRSTLGAHGLVWEENTTLSGKDSDSQRRDLMDNIEAGNYPEYEFGVQLLAEEDEFKFEFDILDPTKIWPEELVPLQIIGKMTLNRNVDNFFAEVEQVMFNPGHLVPGIDFTNDPLLQGRLFSYTDTQLIRLGGPNFHQIPINRSLAPVHNNQRDGYHQHMIHEGPISYQKSSIEGRSPVTVSEKEGAYAHYAEKVDGRKIQARADSFKDHFSQASMFYNSMSEPEKKHIIDAFSFELIKVTRPHIRQNVVNMFANVNADMAAAIAEKVGTDAPNAEAGRKVEDGFVFSDKMAAFVSPALSMLNTVFKPDTRKVAVLIPHKNMEMAEVIALLKDGKTQPEIIAPSLGTTADGELIAHTYTSADPVLFDALLVVEDSEQHPQFAACAETYAKKHFEHYKPMWLLGTGEGYTKPEMLQAEGVMVREELDDSFIDMIAKHRFWDRKVEK